jgi:RNA polymerase sigma-70 factor (ECF subfamily)
VPEEASDADLLAAARAGDRAAMDRLLRRHIDLVHAVCRRMTGNAADAADATQEALIAVVRGIDRYDGRASLRTWIYRVATNACLDELRRRARRPTPGLTDELIEQAPRAGPPDLDATIAERLRIDDALATLPDTFRAAVVLRDVAGLDYAEIAEVLELPVGTVRSRIARGRERLAIALAGNPDDRVERQRGRP